MENQTNENVSEVYLVKDIQKKLNISKASAYNLCHKGYFKVIRYGTKGIRVDKQSFDTWFKSSDSNIVDNFI